MKGEEIIDIVDTGENLQNKYQRTLRGTRARLSTGKEKRGTHKSREADDGKAPKGDGTTEAGLKV